MYCKTLDLKLACQLIYMALIKLTHTKNRHRPHVADGLTPRYYLSDKMTNYTGLILVINGRPQMELRIFYELLILIKALKCEMGVALNCW